MQLRYIHFRKLKVDLEEIISIAQDLVGGGASQSAASKSAQGGSEDPIDVEIEVDSDEEFTQSLSRPLKDWKAKSTFFSDHKIKLVFNQFLFRLATDVLLK